MNCSYKSQLSLYLQGQLGGDASAWMAEHLEQCSHCQLQLQLYLGEIDNPDDWDSVAEYTQTIVQQVINNIPPYPLHVIKRQKTISHQKPNRWVARSIDIMKKATIAVAGFAAVIYFGTLTSPTFATYVNSLVSPKLEQQQRTDSLFEKYPDDPFISRGVQQGYTKKVNMQATDKGFTVDIKEIMADTKDVRIILGITDANGRPIESLFNLFPNDRDERDAVYDIKITDQEGKLYHSNDLPPRMSVLGENNSLMMLTQPLSPYFTTKIEIPAKLNVDVSFHQIGKEKGKWAVTIPVDISKAQKDTTIIPINQTYQSPDGVGYDLKQVKLTPGQTEILLGIAGHDGEDKNLAFEIVDDKGTVLAAWTELDLYQSDDDIPHPVKQNIIYEKLLKTADQKRNYFITLNNLPTDQSLIFRLSKTYHDEPVKAVEMKLNTEELTSKKITAASNGHTLTFSNYSVQELTNDAGKKEWYPQMDVNATLAPGVMDINRWSVKDENGKDYSLFYFTGNRTPDMNGNIKMSGQLLLDYGLEAPPKELTISYKSQVKVKNDVDWEVALPLKE
ncbi:DUF4179 domain-containing protein [Brevibacillus sp. 179-C9.3 HS]|uniref:DUF4179 domain-containing protein n=1 Tax=unclassified Brevibacillus TaxID=2684853 RepID=UPI0039A03895